MATSTDYDAPRNPAPDLAEDSLEALTARRAASAQNASVDVDTEDGGFELPGADVTDEELTVPVVPMRGDEFRCFSCFLVHHRSQLARTSGTGQPICTECD